MTARLLDLSELAARSGVSTERLRAYAETGLLPPARRDGNRIGYPPGEASTVRLLAGADDLGIDGDTLTVLAAAWRNDDCATARQGLADAVSARLNQVQSDIVERQRQMAASGPGTPEWAEVTRASVSTFEDAARLQAAAGALATGAHAGPCGDTCGCTAALTARVSVYHFPSDADSGEAALLCDLVADGGDAHDRIAVWQQVLAHVWRRDPLPDAEDATQTGVVLRFPFDADIAATLGRLAVAEYRCCSFGSYTTVVDGGGLRLEVRMPVEAAETMAAVVGVPDAPAPLTEANGAANRP